MGIFGCDGSILANGATAAALLGLGALALGPAEARASVAADERAVAALDTQFQEAVKKNDAAGMDRILADDFVLVTGRGKAFTKADLLSEARSASTVYERQEEEAGSQKVRVWGDTAVVTALLWIKGTREGKSIDYKLWFSDTYVRTKSGWRYVFGQASLPLPAAN
jgi:ketosteroid isomerase-like protein